MPTPKPVLFVIGPPRSGSSFLSCFLGECTDANGNRLDSAIVDPMPPSAWGQQWNECAYLHRLMVQLLGVHPTIGLPRSARPASLDQSAVTELQTYLSTQYAKATGTYLVKCNFAPFVGPEILAAFPAGTPIQVIVTTRNATAMADSLAAKSGDVTANATAYQTAHATGLTTILALLRARGIKIQTVNFDAVKADQKGTLMPVLTALGITAPDSAWTVYDPSKVTF